jgi:hypothetical protein
MTDDFHRWTLVDKDEYEQVDITDRQGRPIKVVSGDTAFMRVPGGRLYRLREYSGENETAVAMVFVPDTNKSE